MSPFTGIEGLRSTSGEKPTSSDYESNDNEEVEPEPPEDTHDDYD